MAEVLKDKTLEQLRGFEKVRIHRVKWRRRQYDKAEYGSAEDVAGARLADAKLSLADVQEHQKAGGGMMGRTYHVYEERVWGMDNPDIGVMEFDTEKATLLVSCDTLEEAKQWIKEDFEGGVVLSYNNTDGLLTDEQFEYYDERRGVVPDGR